MGQKLDSVLAPAEETAARSTQPIPTEAEVRAFEEKMRAEQSAQEREKEQTTKK